MSISSADLQMMQGAVGGLRTTACSIVRGGVVVGMPTCRVRPDRREISPIPQEELAHDVRWVIYLPPGTDVRPLDQIQAVGCVFLVIIVRDPRTYEVSRQVVCYRAVDATGGVPYVRANATITVSRYIYNPGTKQNTLTQVATGVSVFLNGVSTQIKLQGMAPEFDYLLVCLGTVDIRDGDQLGGINAGDGTVPPLLVTQNCAQHNLAPGWFYRTAEVKALPPGGSD